MEGVCPIAGGRVAQGSGLVWEVVFVGGRWGQGGRFREVSIGVISAAGIA